MELLQEEKHSGWSAGVGYNGPRESFIFKNGLAHRYLHGGEGKRQAPFQRIQQKIVEREKTKPKITEGGLENHSVDLDTNCGNYRS